MTKKMTKKMTKRKEITIAEENDLRREFDYLCDHQQTKAASFENWMRYSQHLKFDECRNLWFVK